MIVCNSAELCIVELRLKMQIFTDNIDNVTWVKMKLIEQPP